MNKYPPETPSPNPFEPLAAMIADAVAARLLAKQPHQRLFSIKDAAEYLDRSQHAIRHLISKKTLPAVRLDGRVYVDREDLDRLIAMSKSYR